LVDATGLLTQIAQTKSDAEVDLLRTSTRQADAAMRSFLDGLRVGADERELAIAAETAMLRAGAERRAFPSLLFSGAQSEIGIGFPGPRRLEDGDQANLMCGAWYRGYNTDLGRAGFV